MRRKRLLQFSLIVVLALVVGAVLAVRYGSPEMLAKVPGNPLGISVPTTVAMPQADVQRLEQALNSADAQAQAVVMEPGFAAAYAAQARPAGMRLSVVADSHLQQGEYGRVDAVVVAADGSSKTCHLFLIRTGQDGLWAIYQAEGA